MKMVRKSLKCKLFYNTFLEEPLTKHLKPSVKFYDSELVTFDKRGRCTLTVVEYDVVLQEVKPTAKNVSPKKLINWETIS